jgi:hypothetical protein
VRLELKIDRETEFSVLDKIGADLLNANYNSSNSVIVTVSTDYSSIVGQILRHQLSHNGEICDGFGIDVPYPDEIWTDNYVNDVMSMFKLNNTSLKGKNIILVEAGVIRGGNYKMVVDIIRRYLTLNEPIVTVALYENIHSIFKSDFVGEYYDNDTQDLTFWWEKYNNHWN